MLFPEEEMNVIRIRRGPSKKKKQEPPKKPQEKLSQDIPLSNNLEENVHFFQMQYQKSTDFITRSFVVGKRNASILYIDGLSDTQKLDEYVLNTLIDNTDFDDRDFLLSVKNKLPISNIKKVSTYLDCMDAIINGNPILLFDELGEALSLGLVNFKNDRLKSHRLNHLYEVQEKVLRNH